MFTATWMQTATYLLAICPFSIAFLVFMNSSVSFVISDLIKLPSGEGDAAGTLGFADELLALVACPLWGIISDRIGVRNVCCAGYAVIALSLVLFVQARNVYPELLLGRLLFCVGGSAAATMVTATLPAITAPRSSVTQPVDGDSGSDGNERLQSAAPRGRRLSSTVAPTASAQMATAEPTQSESEGAPLEEKISSQGSTSRLAGFVGMLTGCGALIALFVFLPLPARFEHGGVSAAEAIRRSYYVVAAVALVVSVACFLGLRGLHGDQEKSLLSLFRPTNTTKQENVHEATPPTGAVRNENHRQSPGMRYAPNLSYVGQTAAAFVSGFRNADIGLGYVGGFVARASSVGISLFIPLYVNQYYRSSGLCNQDNLHDGSGTPSNSDLGDIKESCPRAYVVASILTGVSQLIALISAPIFGFISGRSRFSNFPLLVAACSGIAGYVMLALLPNPQVGDGHRNIGVFVTMALIGISQIGAIVCSLAVLGNGILEFGDSKDRPRNEQSNEDTVQGLADDDIINASEDEHSPLLPEQSEIATKPNNLAHVKGSIAGMYSLFGGAGILLLTKLGGLLFDKLSPQSPFYILAIFNGLLLVSGLIHWMRKRWRTPAWAGDSE